MEKTRSLKKRKIKKLRERHNMLFYRRNSGFGNTRMRKYKIK